MINNKRFEIVNNTTNQTRIVALCPACYHHLYSCNEAFEHNQSFYVANDQSGEKGCETCNCGNHG